MGPWYGDLMKKDNPMTDLPPVEYLEQARRDIGLLASSDMVVTHARALHQLAQARAEIAALKPRETLEQVSEREAAGYYDDYANAAFIAGFLRAAEMAKKGELPDE